MLDTTRLAGAIGPDAAGRLVDVLLGACLLAAVTACWLTGLSPVAITVLVASSLVLERAVSWVTRRRILATAEATGQPPAAALRDLVAGVADRMAVPMPQVVVGSSATGVTVLQGSDGPVLLLSRSIAGDLDEAALRAVVAHELAHLEGGHIDWSDSRDPVAHVVGAAVFWVAVGQHLGPLLSLLGLATYVGAGVFRGTVLPQLYYLCASLGVVLVPLGLIALGHRLEERLADDRAVALTSPRAFCRGLFRVTSVRDDGTTEDVLGATRASERRGLLARVTATHPPLARRFARYDVSIEEIAE
jgi:Zn-dependent protease with chaperone function